MRINLWEGNESSREQKPGWLSRGSFRGKEKTKRENAVVLEGQDSMYGDRGTDDEIRVSGPWIINPPPLDVPWNGSRT